nr:PilC/PilY family type IV pilus protein [Glaciimonas sp. PCH181]
MANAMLVLMFSAAAVVSHPAYAQQVANDTLTGSSSSYAWKTTGGACLTAGTGVTSTIPACKGLAYYSGKTLVGGYNGTFPDPVGNGALRLTNGDTTSGGSNGNNNTGSVISTTPFPTNQGVQITFSAVTYGGNGYSNGSQNSGADGLAFFLMDGSKTPVPGAYGGSLGYSCSQGKSPADGVNGGYLAVGMDEFGNFSNKSDSTSDGNGPNPGSIVVRGSGSITGAALTAAYPKYYPTTLSSSGNLVAAVQSTCKTGFVQDWSSGSNNGSTSIKIADYNLLTAPIPVVTSTNTIPLFNQEAIKAPVRGAANTFTYALSITQDGLLSLSYSVNGGNANNPIVKQSITAGNGPLPTNFLFGFTAGTGGGSNVHEIVCFKAAQITAASNASGTNVQQAAQVRAGSQVYLAFYHPVNSWGQLTASNLMTDASGNVTINSTANWDANCVLTGGACSATRVTTAAAAQGSTARSVLSWNGAAGVPFQYGSLSTAQQGLLGTTDGTTRTAFLRGDRTNEITTAGVGPYRLRNSVLGDIINSSPTWVGPPSTNYTAAGTDFVTQKAIPEYGAAYTAFTTSNVSRAHVVYVGANDGMLHGFRAGANDATGAFSNAVTPNDGQELLAYVPAAVINSIHPSGTPSLDFSSPQYAHNNYVNATPGVGDLYYKGAWHTWLIGGLGPGGNAGGTVGDTTSTATGAVYALDITDPTQFSEGNAAKLVIGEWGSTAVVGNVISCVNDTLSAQCSNSLGSVFGTPIIRRLHDGNWAVIFGNGHNSATGTAGVYVMTVNYATGATTFRFLDTGVKSMTNKNGIDYVSSADLDGDHVTDYLYAGDFLGNVWRFDLTSSDPTKWAASSSPMFTTTSGQPITTRLTVNSVIQAVGLPRIIIAFGTGQQFPQTLSSTATYATGTQSLYGIWDWNLSAWNAASNTDYATLPATPVQSYTTANLQSQTITTVTTASTDGTISGYRTVSQNAVCWSGQAVTAACPAGTNTKFGWQLQLSSNSTTTASEQIIFSPVVAFGTFLVNTTIPTINQVLSCTIQPPSGFTMAISAGTGGAPTSSFFATASANAGFVAANSAIISGLGLSATGSPSIVTAAGKPFLVQQTVSGQGVVTQVDPPSGNASRLTWIKLR